MRSASGSVLLAVISGAWITVVVPASSQTWQLTSAPVTPYYRPYTSIASSADGAVLVATISNGPVIVSANSGATWTTNSPGFSQPSGWASVACSADGRKLAAAVGLYPPGMYTSTNFGETWISNNVQAKAWQAIASSSDGAKLAAVSAPAYWAYQTSNGFGEIYYAGSI